MKLITQPLKVGGIYHEPIGITLDPTRTYIIHEGKVYKVVDDLLEIATDYFDNDALSEVTQ